MAKLQRKGAAAAAASNKAKAARQHKMMKVKMNQLEAAGAMGSGGNESFTTAASDPAADSMYDKHGNDSNSAPPLLLPALHYYRPSSLAQECPG